MIYEDIPSEHTRMRLIIKNPTLEGLLSAVFSLPEELVPEYWFGLEPTPKSKRIYLSDSATLKERKDEMVYGFYHHSAYWLNFSGFVKKKFIPSEGSFWYRFSNGDNAKSNPSSDDLEKQLQVQDHLAKHFDTYHASAIPIRKLEKIEDARARALEKNPPFELFALDPDQFIRQPLDYAEAKHSFPMMGWITYLSQECIDDYALDMDRIRAVAQKVEEVGPTKSAGMLFRIQFHEGRDDWQETLPAITQMCLEADQHRYKLGEYRERPPEERSVDGWHTWLLPDEWWKS